MNQKVNKFSNYVFFVVFISIFLEMKFPIFHWVSLFGMVIMYGLNLVKEKSIKGKIHPASIILCLMAISWVFIRPYVKSGYIAIYGQMVIYGYLIYTQWQMLGKVRKSFVAYAAAAIRFIRPYVKSGYIAIYGQMVIYGYLIYTQWQMLGKVRKSFVAYAAAAISVSFLSMKFPGILTSILVLAMQAWIIFQFLDPILYKIAMLHRQKRLAEEAKRREEEKESIPSLPTEPTEA